MRSGRREFFVTNLCIGSFFLCKQLFCTLRDIGTVLCDSIGSSLVFLHDPLVDFATIYTDLGRCFDADSDLLAMNINYSLVSDYFDLWVVYFVEYLSSSNTSCLPIVLFWFRRMGALKLPVDL